MRAAVAGVAWLGARPSRRKRMYQKRVARTQRQLVESELPGSPNKGPKKKLPGMQ